MCPILSVRALSTVSRGPAAISPAFMQFDYSLTAKWLELLKEVALGLKRVAVLRDAIARG
jgi:hypothetical protein